MELIITARSKEQSNTDYNNAQDYGLSTNITMSRGDGSIKKPFHVKVRIKNKNKDKWSGVIHLELPFEKKNPRFFLPGFMYGRNRGECPQNVPNEFSRIRANMNRPSSPWWMVRGDRLSHPIALVYDSNKIYGFSASPYFIINDDGKNQWRPGINGEFYQYAGYTCSLTKGTIGYTLGYENAPWLFIKSHDVRERETIDNKCFELESGECVEVSLNLYEFEAESEKDINNVIEEVYYEYHQFPRKVSDSKRTTTHLSEAIYNDGWCEDDLQYYGQVFEDNEKESYRYNKIMSFSWTNGLSVAAPMLMAALRTQNEGMRKQALTCISNIVEHSLNKSSGLPYDAFENGKWSIKGWWFDGVYTPGHSGYIVGQGLFYILRSYYYEMKLRGCKHEEWMSFVKERISIIDKMKNADDEYPFIFSEKTGAGIEYDSLGGAWCMAAISYYSWITGDKSFIESLRKSENHYYNGFVKNMECYGGALDIDKAIDSEGIIAYIKAVRYLHAITKEEYLLEHMKDALCYEFTFKFCYNSPIQVPPLSKIGWSSCGGSITSTANPHIHPMSSNLVDEMLYFIHNYKDESIAEYVRNRMEDTVGWGCQTYNSFDREYDYGKKGWMSERFCHSEGLLSERYIDGSKSSTWFCLMPWAGASIIDGLSGDYWYTLK